MSFEKNPRDAVIVAAVRTAVGKGNRGALKDTRPDDLAGTVLAAALAKMAADGEQAQPEEPLARAFGPRGPSPPALEDFVTEGPGEEAACKGARPGGVRLWRGSGGGACSGNRL